MHRREFFQQLFGEEPHGYINIRGIFYKTNKVWSRYTTTYEEADEFIAGFQKEGREVYFAAGAFKDNSKGTATNVLYHKSFYMDIDCGDGKPYANKKAGIAALVSFCETTGLPLPTMIDSGNGVHCYWMLDKEVPYDFWKPTAMGLKELSNKLGFRTDPSVVGDGASLLRVPDTYNTKDSDNPKPVVVKHVGETMTLEEFQACVPAAMTHESVRVAPIDDLTRSLMGDYPSCSFEVLLRKSLKFKEHKVREKVLEPSKDKDRPDDKVIVYKDKVIEACAGCLQIKFDYENRETLDYKFWWDAVSIAKFCTDSATAIPTISEGHPQYDTPETRKAIDSIKKPHTCAEFQRNNPGLCNGCIHKGKINTPIVLGRFMEYAQPSDNIIEDVAYDGFTETSVIEAPIAYPWPWVRPKQGGLARRDFDDAEQAEDEGRAMETFVYQNDLWVKQVLSDPDSGQTVHMVHIQPDGPGKKRVVEFMLTMEEVAKRDRLQGRLAFHGVHGAVIQSTCVLIQQYIEAWVAKLINEKRECQARTHYGWHDNAFVVGKREYTAHRVPVYSPPSRATEGTASAFDPIGTLEEWTAMANLYGSEGNEIRAFILFIGFGAPLYRYTKQGSCMVHLTNKDSGVGKSTAQKVSASIWGDPKELMLLRTDTDNARYHQLGVMRNLPVFVDEITNMPPDQLSDLAFRVSENRGKHRQHSHGNVLRRNDTKWETIVVSSGNNSLYDTLKQHRINMGGEMNRVIELPLSVQDTLSIEEASHWYEYVLPNNYGTAGHVYSQYLADASSYLAKETFECYQSYVEKFNFQREHRMFRAVCAAAFTGARAAKELGLHNIDVDRVEQWAVRQLGGIRAAVKEASSQDSVAVLGQFLNAYKRNELVLNAGTVMAGGLELSQIASKEPFGQLAIRVEQDKKRMFISKSVLMAWCGEHRVHFALLIEDLDKAGMLISKSIHKRLAEGTSSEGLPVSCICVDLSEAKKLDIAKETPED